jgi:hypothetical protein
VTRCREKSRHYDAAKSNLAAAKSAHGSLVKAHADDQTASKHLATIGQHHATAEAAIAKLDPGDGQGPVDSKVVQRHCGAAIRALRQCKAQHVALAKHLNVERLDAGGKGKAKPESDGDN